jgi:hypothetical protein
MLLIQLVLLKISSDDEETMIERNNEDEAETEAQTTKVI